VFDKKDSHDIIRTGTFENVMNTHKEAIHSLRLKRTFDLRPEIGIVYLFGSRANNTATPQSDFDIAVYFDEPDLIKRNNLLFLLAGEISNILGTDGIDIHSLNDLSSPSLKYRIISEGAVIFEREAYRVLIEPRILNEYFDFFYLLQKNHLTRQTT